jgi:hypothetical protein
MKTRRTLQAMVLAAVFFLASLSAAQVSTSSITGTVVDNQGLVVVGAKVLAKNEGTGVTYETVTTSAGEYTVSSVPPGQYTITVTHAGFRTFSSVHNALTVGQPLVVDANLNVGQVSEVVQVESSYQRVETTNAMVSDVVTRKEVAELPLNGRNPLNLITLEPGLVQRTNNGAGSGTHVFGSRDRAHNVTIDGIDANESSVPNPQGNIMGLTPDTVQEYRVVTHAATPEYGRNSGANVSVATRGGTNDFHGGIFYSHRNTALNANEFFNNSSGLPKPVLFVHSWGGAGGGPIIKNKTFFFVSYQGNRIQQTAPIAQSFGVPRVLTPQARQGFFRFLRGGQNSSSLVDPKTGALKSGVANCSATVTTNCVDTYNIFDPTNNQSGKGPDSTVNSVLGTFPLPNDFTVGDGLNVGGFSWNPPSRFEGPFWMGRLDHKFNDNNNIFFRWIQRDYNTTQGDFLNARPIVFPGFAPLGEVFRIGRNAALSYRRVFSPKVVNEFTTGFSYFKFTFTFGESNPNFADPTKDPPWAQECITGSFGGAPGVAPILNTPFCNSAHTQRAVSTLQYIDNLSVTQGAHTIRTGINFRFYRHNDSRGLAGGRNLNPEILFSGSSRDPAGIGWKNLPSSSNPNGINASDLSTMKTMIDILAGIPSTIQRGFSGYIGLDAFPGGIQAVGTRAKQYDLYVQDEWKMTRTLTMTYGVRWEFNHPPTDCCGGVLVPNLAINGSQGTVTFQKADQWYQRRNANAFAPALAFAWNPRGGKTVYRAGYRMAFDTLSTFQITAISGNVVGAVLNCVISLTNSSSSPTITSSTTPGCVTPSTLDKTISGGFPLTIAPPTKKPSDFFLATTAPMNTALTTAAFDPSLKIPTVHEWDLTIQRQLPAGFTVEIGYIGKRGTHLYRAYDLNQLNVSQAGLLDSFLIARNNVGNGCKADGTGCPPGVTGTPPTLLLSLSSASFLNNSAVVTQLQRNGIGDLIRRLDSSTNTNWKPTCPAGTTPCFPATFARPNPQFGQIFYFDSGGNSNYNAGIVRVRRRFERGLTMGLAYTYGKSIDDMSLDPVAASSGGGLSSTNSRTPIDVNNFRIDRARSDFDDRHVVVANLLYEFPFGRGRKWGSSWPGLLDEVLGGWSFTGIYTFESGEPFSVVSGSRTLNGGTRVSQADLVGPIVSTDLEAPSTSTIKGPVVFNTTGVNVTDPRDPRFSTCQQVIGTQSFLCIPAAGKTGLGRNFFQGPHIWNLDIGVLKNFRITERWQFQFRAEFFNLFNHPNFENARNSTIADANGRFANNVLATVFGQTCCITSSLPSSATVIAVGEPNRVIQFSGKIIF